MTDFEKSINYIRIHFYNEDIKQLTEGLKKLNIRHSIYDVNTYAFYIMHKAMKEFEFENNYCLKVSLTLYAMLCNSCYNINLHIGCLYFNNNIVPHSWITIDGKVIDMRAEIRFDMLIIS